MKFFTGRAEQISPTHLPAYREFALVDLDFPS
jgi:hypothetical protein